VEQNKKAPLSTDNNNPGGPSMETIRPSETIYHARQFAPAAPDLESRGDSTSVNRHVRWRHDPERDRSIRIHNACRIAFESDYLGVIRLTNYVVLVLFRLAPRCRNLA
jgi:hypothetical protein